MNQTLKIGLAIWVVAFVSFAGVVGIFKARQAQIDAALVTVVPVSADGSIELTEGEWTITTNPESSNNANDYKVVGPPGNELELTGFGNTSVSDDDNRYWATASVDVPTTGTYVITGPEDATIWVFGDDPFDVLFIAWFGIVVGVLLGGFSGFLAVILILVGATQQVSRSRGVPPFRHF